MTKEKIALGLVIISTACIIATLFFNNHNNVIIENEDSNQIINTNALTMMYETEAGSGEYQLSNDNACPGEEYIFNETLSKCENGGILSWDSETNRVAMKTNRSDKCYVYFDKYNMPQITKVTATEVTSNSITVNVTASSGDGDIVNYYYSINNGEYITSNSNSYTFENLNAETSYNINVYVTDVNGRKSIAFSVNIQTKLGLIIFYISDLYGDINTYYAENGMTWQDFYNSEYNTGNFLVDETNIFYFKIVAGCNLGALSDTIINENTYYWNDQRT